jgi:hypothetical protein
MVAAQLGVTLSESLIRLRGYAFANDRQVTEVAKDVVARRIRFHKTPEGYLRRVRSGM